MSNKSNYKQLLKKWALDNSELIKDIKNYVNGDDLRSITQKDLLELIDTFPEFVYQGPAYRFLNREQEYSDIHLEKIEFDYSHPNRSWSLKDDAYKSVLKSYSMNNQVVFIYQANITQGFDLCSFCHYMCTQGIDSFNSCLGLLDKETEILVLDYNQLSLVDQLFFKYK